MDGIASVSGVGAVTSQASVQVRHQVAAAMLEKAVAKDQGEAALKLIQSAVVPHAPAGHDLEVLA